MKPTIVFTGGGSSGHVTPNIAVMESLKSKLDVNVAYIGSYTGIEKELIKNVPYHAIHSGKLRRYFSWQNFIDPFKIVMGVGQSWKLLRTLKPRVIFSKGGFVTFPVAIAAKMLKIPIVCHESDFLPGLANRLVFPFAKTICVTFSESLKNIKYKQRCKVTGAPIREAFFSAKAEDFLKNTDFSKSKPILLITGGGLGSLVINNMVYQCLDELLKQFNVIHITGKNKSNPSLKNTPHYYQVEYLNEGMFAAMKAADLIISRAGSNTLYELITLKKKHILIPLTKKASRGDQIDNARYFEKLHLSYVLPEEKLSKESFLNVISKVSKEAGAYQQRLNQYCDPALDANEAATANDLITNILMNYINKNEKTHEYSTSK